MGDFKMDNKKLEEALVIVKGFGYKVIKESEDFDETDNNIKTMIRELAEETGNSAVDAEVEYNQGPGEYGIMVKWGNEEYLCYETEDEAKDASTEGIKNLFDDIGYEGINFDMLGGIDQFVDRDWFDDAKRESAEFYVSDIKESEPERYEEEFGDLDEDEAVEKYLKDGYSDSIEWYIDNFGKNEFNRTVRENNLIDEDKLAESITEEDGPANELARYDGKEIELPCGWYCYCSDK